MSPEAITRNQSLAPGNPLPPGWRLNVRRLARAFIIVYLILLALFLWAAASINSRQTAFRDECKAFGGIIVLSDGVSSCIRLRQLNGTFQL